jgi:ribonuclease P/MRP protein subunit POP1
MLSGQGTKRKNGGDEMTGREKKKQKMNQARMIPVQPSARSSGSGVVSGVYEPSKNLLELTRMLGMRGLPSALDVEKFAEVCSTLKLLPIG